MNNILPAKNICKVLISRNKKPPTLFGAISDMFFHGPETCKKDRYPSLLLPTLGGARGS